MKIVEGRVFIGGKCSDMSNFSVQDIDGNYLIEKEGYVPSIQSIGGGDYIEISIDNATGKVIGWVPITEEKINNLKED